MKILRLSPLLLVLGVAALPAALLAANRVVTITVPVAVAPGQNFTVPCFASTDQGANGEQIGFFFLDYSVDGGVTWTAVCADSNVGASATRNATITAGAAGTAVVVKAAIAFRGGSAGDVDFSGNPMNWTAWNNWDAPPTKYAYILVDNAASGLTIIPTTTYPSGQTAVVSGSTSISTGNNTVVVSSGATVVYQASNSITLQPGFQAVSGSNFQAVISATPLTPVLLAASSTSVAAGGSVTFTAAGGLGTTSYTWSGAASGTGQSATVNFPTAGTYTVTVTNTGSNGLVQTASITVNVYASGYTDPALKILVPTL